MATVINNSKNCKGFTLLEVVIAVVIFSVGLLGLASLQITGIRLSHDSLLRTIANLQAQDMADRMRANVALKSQGTASPYNNPTGISLPNSACIGKDSSGNPTNSQCTPTQLANHDFYEWYAQIRGVSATGWHPEVTAALPSGQAIVCIDSTPNDGTAPPGDPGCDNVIAVPNKPIFAIKIWWSERKLDNNNQITNHRFVTSIAL